MNDTQISAQRDVFLYVAKSIFNIDFINNVVRLDHKRIQQLYGTHDADPENQAKQQRDGLTT